MKSLMVVSLVSAFLYAGLARAEDPVSMLSNNPEEGVTKLKFMDGKIATVNGFLGEIEVPGSDGTVYHVSFEDVALEAASGDPALAEIGRASFRERMCQDVEISVGDDTYK